MFNSIIDVLSVIVAVAAFVISIVTYQKNVTHDRKADTLDAFNLLQEQALDKLNRYKPADVCEYAKHPRSEEYKELSALLARVEHFCVGVNDKIYDEKTVKRLAGIYFIKLYDKLLPIIEKKRDIYTEERLFDDFELLVLRLKKYCNVK